MAIDTTDVRTHGDEQILRASAYLSSSEDRQLVFEEIYRGKNSGKTAKEIANNINKLRKNDITSKRVLEVTNALKSKKLIQVQKIGRGELIFVKVDFFALYKIKILHLARDKFALGNFSWQDFSFTCKSTRNSKDKYTASKAKDGSQKSGRETVNDGKDE